MSAQPSIKYRLTGASVLIAIAIIFLPLILDGQKKNQILDSQIPEKPISGEIILVNINASKSDTPIKTTSPQMQEVQITTKELLSTKKEKTEQSSTRVKATSKTQSMDLEGDKRRDRPNYQGSAFVIQLGSFSNKTNAQKVVEKLKSAGYKAYIKVVKTNNKITHKVLVGPELERKQAEFKISALNKLTKLKSMVLVYDPLKH